MLTAQENADAILEIVTQTYRPMPTLTWWQRVEGWMDTLRERLALWICPELEA